MPTWLDTILLHIVTPYPEPPKGSMALKDSALVCIIERKKKKVDTKYSQPLS